jgi:hypothetical protein
MDWVGDFDDNSRNSTSFNSTPVAVNAIVGTLLLLWVAILEGAQCSIVGLSTVNIETFRETHPHAYKTCKWLHAGSNLEKFIARCSYRHIWCSVRFTSPPTTHSCRLEASKRA